MPNEHEYTIKKQEPLPVLWLGGEDLLACDDKLVEQVEILSEEDLYKIVDMFSDALSLVYQDMLAEIVRVYLQQKNNQ